MNSLDWLKKWADYIPNKAAVTNLDTGEIFSYLEMHRYANRIVNLLGDQIKEGDRIAVLAEQSAFLIALFSACQRLGAILVPINYRLSTPEIHALLKDCSPQLLIYSEHFEEKIAMMMDFYKSFNQIEFIDQVKEQSHLEIIKTNPINERIPIFLFYTSGTTQKPKGVLYTNKMLFWNSLNTTMQLELTSKDRTLNVLPPYHTSGWNIFLTPLLHNGGHISILKKFDAHQVLQFLEKEKATVFICLPTLLQMISKETNFKTSNLSALRYIITGGEFISKDSIEFWIKTKNVFIRPGYGLTEAGPSITSLHQDVVLEKSESIGKANFYVDLAIKNKQGLSLAENEVGELCIKGDVVTPGYWNNSIETKDKLKDGWLFTGDLAYRDNEGFYYLMGRIDDMYISGGENIFPQEIEKVLNQHPAVTKSFVLSVPDEIWGSKGVAFIVAEHHLEDREIKDYLKDKLAKFKHPKDYLFIGEFPLTSVGKISRKDLYRIYQNQLLNHEL